MKIRNIRWLANAIFSYGMMPNYLDQVTGDVVSEHRMTTEMQMNKDRYMLLPKYSSAHIRQRYMNMMFAEGIIEDLYNLAEYPSFTLEDISDEDIKNEYISKAHELCEYFLMESTCDDLPGTIRQHETYADFESSFELEYAKRWCDEHGFEYEVQE